MMKSSSSLNHRVWVVLVSVVLASGWLFPAHGQQSGAALFENRTGKVQLQVLEFTKLSGAARLDFLQTELPHLLAASFLSYSWLDVSLAEPIVGERTVARETGDRSPRKSARVFQLRGTFLEIGSTLRVDLALKDLADDRTSHMFELLDEDAVLVSVQNLGKRIASAIESRLPAPTRQPLVYGIASHFTKTEGSETYHFLGDLLPDATLTLLSHAKLANVNFQQLPAAASGKPPTPVACEITGEYSVTGNSVQIIARMREKDGFSFRIEVKGSVNEIPHLSEELSRRVAEIARGRVTPEGNWRTEEVSLRGGTAQQYFAEGERYSEAKQDSPAIVMFRKALEMKPDFAEARSGLAQIYMSQKEYDAAISEYRSALEFNPDQAATRYELGTAYLRKGDHQEATVQFQEALRETSRGPGRNPRLQANLYSGLGEAYLLQGKYDEAIVHYLHARDTSRENPDVYHSLGRAYATSGKFQEGIQTLEEARRRFPRDPGFTAELAAMYSTLGKQSFDKRKYEEALGAFEKSIELRPDDPRGLAEANNYAALIVGLDLPVRDLHRGIEYATESVKLDPANEWSFRVLGKLYSDDRNYSEAIKSIQRAIDIQPTEMAYRQLSESYRLMLKYDEAVDAANHALKIRNTADGHIELTLAYWASRDYNRALKSIQSALSIDSNNDWAYRVEAYVYDGKHDWELAIEALKKAISIQATQFAYDQLGSIYEKLGKHPEALAAERQALKLDPHYLPAYESLGKIQLSLKDYRGALDTAQKAIQSTAGGYDLLSDAYHGLGNDQEAVRLLEAYRQKDPDNWNILNPLASSYHDRRFDYERAYQMNANAYKLRPFDIFVRTNFAETCLTSGRYDEALQVANSALMGAGISLDQQLSMRLISIAALLFQGKAANAFSEVGEFIRNYKSLPVDFEQAWVYAGTRRLVQGTSKLDEPAKSLVLSLIDILESPRSEADTKLKSLEASLQQRLELKKVIVR